ADHPEQRASFFRPDLLRLRRRPPEPPDRHGRRRRQHVRLFFRPPGVPVLPDVLLPHRRGAQRAFYRGVRAGEPRGLRPRDRGRAAALRCRARGGGDTGPSRRPPEHGLHGHPARDRGLRPRGGRPPGSRPHAGRRAAHPPGHPAHRVGEGAGREPLPHGPRDLPGPYPEPANSLDLRRPRRLRRRPHASHAREQLPGSPRRGGRPLRPLRPRRHPRQPLGSRGSGRDRLHDRPQAFPPPRGPPADGGRDLRREPPLDLGSPP
ncbi:MAG: Auxin efflux carrier family protein, partial [uncultured Rubrobacteraceae bacterium]